MRPQFLGLSWSVCFEFGNQAASLHLPRFFVTYESIFIVTLAIIYDGVGLRKLRKTRNIVLVMYFEKSNCILLNIWIFPVSDVYFRSKIVLGYFFIVYFLDIYAFICIQA